MKFGLESEKFLFDVHTQRPSKGVFRFLDALSDFDGLGADFGQHITNEFVLSMVELGTSPSSAPVEIIKEYLFNHLLLQTVAQRENVSLVSLGSMPMDYQPHMLPKWPYFVQNSILGGKKQTSWMMSKNSPLLSAGNCAGVHVHAEVETAPEFLFSNRELQDKFNMGLMMSPMIAFSSSPYFFGKHKAASMRGLRYYYQVYKNFPLNGALPPVMNSSAEVLSYINSSINLWVNRGKELGLDKDDLQRLTLKKGANWNPVRWNRLWNTIELRCLDSDRIDLDCSKFIWVINAFKRMNLQGENLETHPIKSRAKVDAKMIDECFEVSGRKVSILNSMALEEIFMRAVMKGTRDDLVEQYLYKLADFSEEKMGRDQHWIFQILKRVLESHETTAQKLLNLTRNKSSISEETAVELVNFAIDDQKKIIKLVKKYAPDVIERLQQVKKLNL